MATSHVVATSLASTITLNDGVQMPLFGLGVFLSQPGSTTEDAVTYALQYGYRMVDTAQIYKNEEDVGKAVKRSGLRREDVFIVTKVSFDHGYEYTTKTVHESLKKMATPYIDLYLIHAPRGRKNVETFRALLDLKAKGLIRSVGVSNFGIAHLEGLHQAGLPRPSVNQISLSLFHRQNDVVNYCRQNGIALMGYRPIVNGKRLDDPDLLTVANRHHKTAAQVLIRWSVQQGYITIPKSTKPHRIDENAQIFDFSLTDEDLALLMSKPEEIPTFNPTADPWEG
jgi:diketogulonate reductase-like aldo/keto reductase